MAKDAIRVGIVGASARYGWGQRAHLPALLALPEFELTAVGTAHQDTAEESARIYGARMAFHDWRMLVTHPDVELVVVCVRADEHFEIAKGALQAGKHVFCEWPMGASAGAARELAALAKAKGVRTLTGLQSQGSPALMHLRDVVAKGLVGHVLSANMSLAVERYSGYRTPQEWAADPEKGARVLGILAGHSIDAFCYCAGEFREIAGVVKTHILEPSKVRSAADAPGEGPDAIVASGILESGAAATLSVLTSAGRAAGWRMEIHGTKGTLVATAPGIPNYTEISLFYAKAGDPTLDPVKPPPDPATAPSNVPAGPPVNVAALYQRLARAIRDGQAAQPDFEWGARRHRMLHAIEVSSRTGQRQVLT